MYAGDDLETLEEKIRDAEAKMDEEIRKNYFRISKKLLKDPDTYATMNYSLSLGLHHFYLQRYDRFAEDLTGNIVALILVFNGFIQLAGANIGGGLLSLVVGIGIGIAFAVMELLELFKSERIVRNYNLTQKANLIEHLTSNKIL